MSVGGEFSASNFNSAKCVCLVSSYGSRIARLVVIPRFVAGRIDGRLKSSAKVSTPNEVCTQIQDYKATIKAPCVTYSSG